jgi:hypothetical protein
MKRTPQYTLPFKKQNLKVLEELKRMEREDNTHLPDFVISCIKKEIGYM